MFIYWVNNLHSIIEHLIVPSETRPLAFLLWYPIRPWTLPSHTAEDKLASLTVSLGLLLHLHRAVYQMKRIRLFLHEVAPPECDWSRIGVHQGTLEGDRREDHGLLLIVMCGIVGFDPHIIGLLWFNNVSRSRGLINVSNHLILLLMSRCYDRSHKTVTGSAC